MFRVYLLNLTEAGKWNIEGIYYYFDYNACPSSSSSSLSHTQHSSFPRFFFTMPSLVLFG